MNILTILDKLGLIRSTSIGRRHLITNKVLFNSNSVSIETELLPKLGDTFSVDGRQHIITSIDLEILTK